MKKRLLLVSAAIAAFDQVIKIWIRAHAIGNTIAEIPGLIAITHSVNTGAAFSMMSGKSVLLAIASVILIMLMYVYAAMYLRLSAAAQIALAGMIGGGIGNLIDRIACGGVTDYIRLLIFDFPIFNIADIAISLSIAMMMILLAIGKLEIDSGEEDG